MMDDACVLFELGTTNLGVSLLDEKRANRCCVSSAEEASKASARRLRSTPYLQEVSLSVRTPPYTRVEREDRADRWVGEVLPEHHGLFANLRRGMRPANPHERGHVELEEVVAARVSLSMDEVLYGDLTEEFREVLEDRGRVRRLDETMRQELARRFGDWIVSEVAVGGQCGYRRVRGMAPAPTTWVESALATLFDGYEALVGTDDDDARLLVASDGARISVVDARPPLAPRRTRSFEPNLVHWRDYARDHPQTIALLRKASLLHLLRQAYVSLLRLLTLRRARERWAAKLKDMLDHAVETARFDKVLNAGEAWVVDPHAVCLGAGLAEGSLASVFVCEDQIDLDDQLAALDDDDEANRLVLEDNIRKLDNWIANQARQDAEFDLGAFYGD